MSRDHSLFMTLGRGEEDSESITWFSGENREVISLCQQSINCGL